MRTFIITLLAVAAAAIAFLVSSSDASALDYELIYPPELMGMTEGAEFPLGMSLSFDESESVADIKYGLQVADVAYTGEFSLDAEGNASVLYTANATVTTIERCILFNGRIPTKFSIKYTDLSTNAPRLLSFPSPFIDCSVLIAPDRDLITQTTNCGANNDTFESTQPGVGIAVGEWQSGVVTVDVSPITPYTFTSTSYQFTDTGETCLGDAPISPDILRECGIENDLITLKDQPATVDPNFNDSGWDKGVRTITYSPHPNYHFPTGVTGEFRFEDSGNCITDIPLAPTWTEVCGPRNDVVLVPGGQPANIAITQSDDWSDDDSWTVTYTHAEHWVLPSDFDAVHTFTDLSTPCPTDAPVPPVQAAICGPNNDLVTIPPQPDGVTLERDSGWEENRRTITFAVDPAFITEGETSFTFTDANEVCMKTVTVQLMTDDDGSVEDAEWKLFAPVAAQSSGAEPYLEGAVGAGNVIVIENLIAGQYRLVVDADGYERVDELFTVTDGIEPQTISIAMSAIQPLATPTVEPTPQPTSEPVTSLPSTGSGSGSGAGILVAGMFAGVLFAGLAWLSPRPVRQIGCK